eukprot:SAG31_NODE_1121_length_9797_cov_16.183749_4_plen_65_part_00
MRKVDVDRMERMLSELREIKRSMDMAGRDSAVKNRPETASKLRSCQKDLEDLGSDIRLVWHNSA